MSPDTPVLDGRTREAIVELARHRGASYSEQWDPTGDDLGTVLLELFGDMTEEVVERLDGVPAKQRIAFYDHLGFSAAPPQPARLPLVFTVAPGASENVSIPAGTQASATVEATPPDRTFEIGAGDGFEATPARLTELVSVDGREDRLFDHQATLEAGGELTVFAGDDHQCHALYVGHQTLLQLDPASTVEVSIETTASPVRIGE